MLCKLKFIGLNSNLLVYRFKFKTKFILRATYKIKELKVNFLHSELHQENLKDFSYKNYSEYLHL